LSGSSTWIMGSIAIKPTALLLTGNPAAMLAGI
jgi:hypothetical protein